MPTSSPCSPCPVVQPALLRPDCTTETRRARSWEWCAARALALSRARGTQPLGNAASCVLQTAGCNAREQSSRARPIDARPPNVCDEHSRFKVGPQLARGGALLAAADGIGPSPVLRRDTRAICGMIGPQRVHHGSDARLMAQPCRMTARLVVVMFNAGPAAGL